MFLHNEIAEQIGSQEAIFSETAVNEALQIEQVLNLAYEIRRARGGLFGYDLEDWLQAERELADRNRARQLRLVKTASAEPLEAGPERNSERCSAPHN